jgi:predicted transcriptional regulator
LKNYDLTESEYRFASIIWDNEPVNSGQLVSLCIQQLGWKKSTTYTVLKKLCDKGLFKNENAVVSSFVDKRLIQKKESEQFLDRVFQGSLPAFLNAFTEDKKLTDEDIKTIKSIIEKGKK